MGSEGPNIPNIPMGYLSAASYARSFAAHPADFTRFSAAQDIGVQGSKRSGDIDLNIPTLGCGYGR